jgi:hypothetical protein
MPFEAAMAATPEKPGNALLSWFRLSSVSLPAEPIWPSASVTLFSASAPPPVTLVTLPSVVRNGISWSWVVPTDFAKASKREAAPVRSENSNGVAAANCCKLLNWAVPFATDPVRELKAIWTCSRLAADLRPKAVRPTSAVPMPSAPTDSALLSVEPIPERPDLMPPPSRFPKLLPAFSPSSGTVWSARRSSPLSWLWSFAAKPFAEGMIVR